MLINLRLIVHALLDVDRPETWQWMLILTWRHPSDKPLPESAAARKYWNECADKLAEPFQNAFAAAPDEAKLYCERLGHWPTVRWDTRMGKIALAGDAAHPMTFPYATLYHSRILVHIHGRSIG